MQINRKRVAVLRGGNSDEYHHSMKTGAFVLANLPAQYEGVDILLDKDGVWHINGAPKEPIKILNQIDVLFNALHGRFGEDGGVQHFLKTHGIRHTSSDTISSNFSLNKDKAKNIFQKFEIKTPSHLILRKEDLSPKNIYDIFSKLPHPVVVKPVASGSSFGVSLALNLEQLTDAINKVFDISDIALIEEFIEGREVTVGVIENFRDQRHYLLPAIEIRKNDSKELFNIDRKILNDLDYTNEFLTNLEKSEISKIVRLAFKIMGLRSYASFDLIINRRRGIYLLEANSQPKLHNDSHFVKAFELVGIEPKFFVESVLQNSVIH